jgi:signal transduction histidine kinase
MRLSLRYQFLLPMLFVLLGVVGGGSAAIVWATRAAVRDRLEQQLTLAARTLAAASFPLTTTVLQQIKGLTGAEFLLIEADGRRLATHAAALGLPLDPPDEAARADGPVQGPNVPLDGMRYLNLIVTLRRPALPPARLHLLYPESAWEEAVARALYPAFVFALVAGLAGLAATERLATWLSRRIGAVKARTQAIAAGDFRPLPEPAGHDEIHDLARAINDMAAQLARLHETVRITERLRLLGQVSGGLIHQLRNATTGAKLAIQVHAQDCPGTPASRDDLQVALRQMALMEEHLQRFLQLGSREPNQPRRGQFVAWVADTVELMRPRCRHRQIQLTWHPPPPGPMVECDVGLLTQILVNLLDNAIDAVSDGGHVEVTLMESPQATVIAVSDDGPGPPPELAPMLFEPFATGKPQGIGLGLAVARDAAVRLNGTLRWRREHARTIFELSFPSPAP